MIRGVKGSGVKITARSFKFDGDKLKYKLNYQGKGKAPDKRFDKNCEGLCIFIWPSGTIVFYAYKWVEMYNHKKGKLEKNCKYKRMFKFQDIKGYKYRDAKDKLKEALECRYRHHPGIFEEEMLPITIRSSQCSLDKALLK